MVFSVSCRDAMKSVSAEAGFARNVSMHALLKHESATDLYESLSEASYSNRPTTPASPEVEEFLLEESELDLSPLSKFENLPTEMIQKIAVGLSTDTDLSNLSLSSTAFADVLNPDEADIWRKRFLARYDYPTRLDEPEDYAVAYKLRRFVLRRLDGEALRNAERDKSLHQLLVILDMVLETYTSSKPHLPSAKTSKNLAAMSSPSTSRWIVEFLGCALFGSLKAKYGRPNKLFDTLQVALSHLVLHQRSPVLLYLTSSRENYDLARVYHYNMPFNTILEDCTPQAPNSTRFPGLKRPRRFNVNMHTLLHIRNFWQRHFSEDSTTAPTQGIGENTYTSMARNLVTIDKIPRKWDAPLDVPRPAHLKWIGHYSCLHPWPKSRESLEEQQSCAEDWDKIDPMTLELESSSNNKDYAFWPPLFSSIPVFQSLLPEKRRGKDLNLTYIRGLSSFLDVHRRKAVGNAAESSDSEAPKWRPFLASRVNGFIHDVEPQDVVGRKLKRDPFSASVDNRQEQVVPGWKHIVMVIYKPPKRHLLTTIEYAQEDYGGSTGVTNDFNTANIWNQGDAAGTNTQATNASGPVAAANSAQDSDIQAANGVEDATAEEINAALERDIYERIENFSKEYTALLMEQDKPAASSAPFPPFTTSKPKPKLTLPPLFSMKHILSMDDGLSPAQFKTWDDIDYAYAYEGVIIPGGKIMLGRWWRIGAHGMGPGKEIGPDNVGVEVRPVVQPHTDTPNNSADDESEGKISRKRKKVTQGTRKSKRARTKVKGKARTKSGLYAPISEDDETGCDDDMRIESEDEDQEDREPDELETGVEYEFVTMLNGQESRAINATKGLERGPFVFWAD